MKADFDAMGRRFSESVCDLCDLMGNERSVRENGDKKSFPFRVFINNEKIGRISSYQFSPLKTITAQTRHEAGAPVDPVYAEIAAKTGGRVYDMRKPEDARALQQEIARPRREERLRRWKDWWNISRISERLPGSDEARLLVYALLKWLAYAGWCFVGLGIAGKSQRRLRRAAIWGSARVGLGIVFGIMVFYLFVLLRWVPPAEWPWYIAIYLALYVPVRWIEWSIMAHAMDVESLPWRGGGIGVSCLAGIVQILLFGSLIPVGRFLC